MKYRIQSFFDKTLATATSPASLSWQVFIPTALISILIQLFASGDVDFDSALPRAIVAVFSVVPIFGLLWLAHKLEIANPRVKILVILLTLAVSGGVRGLTLSLFLITLGIEAGSPWSYRVWASAITMGLTVAVVTYARATYLKHGESVSALLEDTQKLSAALNKIREESAAESGDQLSEVSWRIVTELKNIELNPAVDQIVAIQKMVDERVRPLSAKFASELSTYEPLPVFSKKIRLRDRLPSIQALTATPSLWFSLAVSITPFSLTTDLFGFQKAILVSFLIFLSLTPSIVIGMAIARLVIPLLPKALQLIALTVILFLISLPGVFSTYLALIDTPNPEIFVLGGMITFPVYGLIVTFSGALFRDLKFQTDELSKTKDALSWAIARANLLTWYNRGVTTRLLHGPVQNAMHAALIKLQTSSSRSAVDDVMSALRERIALADKGGSVLDSAPELIASFSSLKQLWDSVADVSVTLSDSVKELFAIDLPAAVIAFDVASEVCSNAVRHGGATKVSIEILGLGQILSVEVRDDGAVPDFRARTGVGSKFLDSCSVGWELTREGDLNKLVVNLPCEKLPQLADELAR